MKYLVKSLQRFVADALFDSWAIIPRIPMDPDDIDMEDYREYEAKFLSLYDGAMLVGVREGEDGLRESGWYQLLRDRVDEDVCDCRATEREGAFLDELRTHTSAMKWGGFLYHIRGQHALWLVEDGRMRGFETERFEDLATVLKTYDEWNVLGLKYRPVSNPIFRPHKRTVTGRLDLDREETISEWKKGVGYRAKQVKTTKGATR